MSARQFRKKMIRGMLDFLTLKWIDAGEVVHGYGILKHIRQKYGFLFSVSEIYPTLLKLEELGLIRSRWNLTDHPKPRKEYSTTERARSVILQSEQLLSSLRNGEGG